MQTDRIKLFSKVMKQIKRRNATQTLVGFKSKIQLNQQGNNWTFLFFILLIKSDNWMIMTVHYNVL